MTDILPIEITDEQIREMLRPRTALERSAKAIPILKLLAKHGELPSAVIIRVFRDPNTSSLSHPPMGSLVEEGYVTSRKGAFHGSINFFFKITAKGRQALK